ncbi:MAG: Hpt domain-containing protein [Leptolyngbyaceae cyanobacterium CRU_2_3]|nr:Hpt domain-containing protein [Leptolyngbyaceae cyanobacterium CRU_2_3]
MGLQYHSEAHLRDYQPVVAQIELFPHIVPAIALKDLSQVVQSAHYLKGSSANVGAKAMHSAAAQLEKQAQQNQLAQEEELLAELMDSLHLIRGFIVYRKSQQSKRSV